MTANPLSLASTILVAAFCIGALGGLTAELRTGRSLTWRSSISTALFSGLASLTIALLLFSRYEKTDPLQLLGICALATLGGPQGLDFVIATLQKAWLTFKKMPNGNGNGTNGGPAEN